MAPPINDVDTLSIDAYGTIFDSGPVFERATAEIARHHGGLEPRHLSATWNRHFNQLYHEVTDQSILAEPFPTIRHLTSQSLRGALQELNRHDDDPAHGAAIWVEHLLTIRLYDDVVEALNRLTGRYRLILTSDSDEEFILPVLKQLALPFERVFVSETCRSYKMQKNGGLLERALRDANADPARTLHIGDSTADLIAAERAGCRSVWLQRPGHPHPGRTPWRTMTSLHELADL